MGFSKEEELLEELVRMSRHVIETKKSEHAAGKTEIKCSCGADALVKKFDVKNWKQTHQSHARHGWV